MKKCVAIIPARGGSKRVPRKNIIEFEGKPLIAWTIEAAIKSNLFDYVVVSTDDKEIAEVSRQFGAYVPFLRNDASDDFATASEATIYTLKQLEDDNMIFDTVVQLMAVCPLRDTQVIIDAYESFIKNNNDFLLSCYKYTWMNPWWAYTLDKKGLPTSIFENNTSKRSQDLPELYSPTGAIWIAKIEKLYQSNTFYGKDHVFFPIDWKKAVDIDNYEDIELARVLKQLM